MEHILCDSKCKFDSSKCNSNQKWENDMCRCKCKKQSVCKKDSSTCSFEINACFKSIVNNSVITCSRIINVTDTVLINSDDKKINYKIICYILRSFFY